MANIYGVCNAKPLPHNGYSDFVQHTNPLKEGLLQTLSTDNLLNSLNSVDSTESVNPLIKLDYNESLELANLLILFNYRESRESANSLKMLQAPNSGFARRLGNSLEIQKEKGSTANAAFEMIAFLHHEENQHVNRLSFSESDNSPLLRRLVLRNPLRVAQMHTEIIGIQNLQVTKRYSQNNPEIIGAVGSVPHRNTAQPFGSMPRLSNSLRKSRFIHPALLSSPSSFIAIDRRSERSGSRRSCTTFLSLWFSLVDIGVHPFILIIMVINVHHCKPISKAPQVLGTHAGLLTTNAKATSEAAMNNHITPLNGRNSLTLNKFTWRFLALNRHDKKAKPCRLSVEATTEHEARRILAPHFILSFAARLPVQEVHYA